MTRAQTLQVFIVFELILVIVGIAGLNWEPGQLPFIVGFACTKVATIAAIAALIFLAIFWGHDES